MLGRVTRPAYHHSSSSSMWSVGRIQHFLLDRHNDIYNNNNLSSAEQKKKERGEKERTGSD